MSVRFFLILYYLCFAFPVFAQFSDTLPHPVKPDQAYWKSYLLDTRDIVVSPFHWNGRQWIYTVSVLGSAVVLYKNDLPIHDLFQQNRNTNTEKISGFFEPWGSGLYSMSAMSLFYLHGAFFHNAKSKKTALLGLKAYLISGMISRVPKYVLQRHRPYQDPIPTPYRWEGPFHGVSSYISFPSGHTVSVFAVATIVASEYKDKPWVAVAVYSLATCVALSRIHDNKHWASDVFVGAALGFGISKLIYKRDNWKQASGR